MPHAPNKVTKEKLEKLIEKAERELKEKVGKSTDKKKNNSYERCGG